MALRNAKHVCTTTLASTRSRFSTRKKKGTWQQCLTLRYAAINTVGQGLQLQGRPGEGKQKKNNVHVRPSNNRPLRTHTSTSQFVGDTVSEACKTRAQNVNRGTEFTDLVPYCWCTKGSTPPSRRLPGTVTRIPPCIWHAQHRTLVDMGAALSVMCRTF